MVKYKFNGDACVVDLYQTQFFKTSCLNEKKMERKPGKHIGMKS